MVKLLRLARRKERARRAEQIRWGLEYIRRVYGPQPTWAYEQGGILPPGITRARNDTDKPERVVSLSLPSDSDFERWMVALLRRALRDPGERG